MKELDNVHISAASWYARVPKVELHLHLEGAIPLDALWELVCKYGGDPAVPTLDALADRFTYRDFPHFIDTWIWKNRFLREYDDFSFIAEAVAKDLARQNIRYVEAFYSPADFARHGLEVQGLTEAIRRGLARVSDLEVALVADFVRDSGPDNAMRILPQLAEVRALGVVGVGIGGSEQRFPPEPFAEVYEQARQLGFRTSAHAGEAAGPVSVWGAINALKVDRIGHGTRAQEDETLLEHLAEHHIPLEMCPLSNLRTGVVAILEEHPIRRFVERGIVVTVASDDPKMFGNSLAEELWHLEHTHGLTRDQTRQVLCNGARVSWLEPERRQQLEQELCTDPSWNEPGVTRGTDAV